jgi:hypothetical protein
LWRTTYAKRFVEKHGGLDAEIIRRFDETGLGDSSALLERLANACRRWEDFMRGRLMKHG